MNRRGFLGAMLAACAGPAIVRAESLMPVRVPLPKEYEWVEEKFDFVNQMVTTQSPLFSGRVGAYGTGIANSIAPQQRQLNLERAGFLYVIINGVEHKLPLYD